MQAVPDRPDRVRSASKPDRVAAEQIADRIWQTRSQLELAVVEYLGWFNTARLHQALGDRPPAEFEALAAPQRKMTTPTTRILETT